jgi:hypothetical protein
MDFDVILSRTSSLRNPRLTRYYLGWKTRLVRLATGQRLKGFPGGSQKEHLRADRDDG